jgi:hypothetical protein
VLWFVASLPITPPAAAPPKVQPVASDPRTSSVTTPIHLKNLIWVFIFHPWVVL